MHHASSIGHLTSSPALGASLATFWGRNDAVTNLVLRELRWVRRIAVLGGGVCEPLSLAASRFLAPDARVFAFDIALAVHSALRRLTSSPTSRAAPRAGEPWTIPSPTALAHLHRAGVDTDQFSVSPRGLSVGPGIRRRVVNRRADLSLLLEQWRTKGTRWDLIICNNVLPNLSMARGPGVVRSVIDACGRVLTPTGAAILGIVDSQLYLSAHPERSAHFAAEVSGALQSGPLSVDGWIARAWVRERIAGAVLLDGYSSLIVRPPRTPPLFPGADLRCATRIGAISWGRVTREELLGGKPPFVFFAARGSDGRYDAAVASQPFPQVLVSFFGSHPNCREVDLRVAESLLARA